MRKTLRIILFGFLLWLIPFVVSFPIFTLRESNRALFESIMPVVVTICVVFFAILHLRKAGAGFLKEGFLIGIVWYLICIVIDLLMFMWGPMKMTFGQYMADIGLTYVIIPTVTVGYGYLMSIKE
jgi:hypothetical protein